MCGLGVNVNVMEEYTVLTQPRVPYREPDHRHTPITMKCQVTDRSIRNDNLHKYGIKVL